MPGIGHRAGLGGIAWLLAAAGAAADPTVTESIFYYEVSGATSQEVRRELNRLGPFDTQGRHFDALARWFVRWRFNHAHSGQRCTITTVATAAEVAIQFPRLKETPETPEPLKRAFAEFTTKLLMHERNHGGNAIDTAKSVEAGIRALPPQAKCADLERTGQELAQSLVKKANQWDRDYDERTRHGATEGVRFP
jgi:predicted secreted Zn-dependent protease